MIYVEIMVYVAEIVVLLVFAIIMQRYLLMLFDDLKERIDRLWDKDKWQDNELDKLRERIAKLEQNSKP